MRILLHLVFHILALAFNLSFLSLHADVVDDKGIWHGQDVQCHHAFDPHLAAHLVNFFQSENAHTLVDFGCGLADYQHLLLQNGFQADAYDGNPDTPMLTQGRARIQDLSVPFDLSKRFDWVMSLEVGEHLPQQYERIFIENLIRHARKGIVLSWAIPDQGGYGHFNEQSNQYVKEIMTSYGWSSDEISEKVLRESAGLYWFKNTIMVFRKTPPSPS